MGEIAEPGEREGGLGHESYESRGAEASLSPEGAQTRTYKYWASGIASWPRFGDAREVERLECMSGPTS